MADKKDKRTHYDILGVSRNASLDEIKKAFREKSHDFHPDKSDGATEALKKFAAEEFIKINNAYEALRDPQKRQRYDYSLAQEEENETRRAAAPPPRPSPEPARPEAAPQHTAGTKSSSGNDAVIGCLGILIVIGLLAGAWHSCSQTKPSVGPSIFNAPPVARQVVVGGPNPVIPYKYSTPGLIDYVIIGNYQSESSHGLQGQSGNGFFNGRPYRDGQEFSWELKIATDAPTDLSVTYWGSDIGREFDVLANDTIIATQRLQNNKPEQFFEVQ